jgi:hypothetical protein
METTGIESDLKKKMAPLKTNGMLIALAVDEGSHDTTLSVFLEQ